MTGIWHAMGNINSLLLVVSAMSSLTLLARRLLHVYNEHGRTFS